MVNSVDDYDRQDLKHEIIASMHSYHRRDLIREWVNRENIANSINEKAPIHNSNNKTAANRRGYLMFIIFF